MQKLWIRLGSMALVLVGLGAQACGDDAGGGSGEDEDGGSGLPKGSGDVCANDGDCPKGERCNTEVDDGVCMTLRSGGVGDACSSDELCGSELNCVEDECREAGEAGDACRVTTDCAEGRCVDSECVDPGSLDEGEACDDSSLCGEGLVCSWDDVCALACDSDSDCPGGNCADVSGEEDQEPFCI
jgi:hypothetical protein